MREFASAAWAVAGERSGEGGVPLLVRSAPADLLLRHNRPESGLHSLELGRPSLAAALGGVNEAGLAVAGVGGGPGSFRAAALVGDCLARFESVAAALDGCRARRGAGEAELLFLDARGEIAGLSPDKSGRALRRPDGCLRAGRVAGALSRSESRVLLDPRGRRLGLEHPNFERRWVSLSGAPHEIKN